MVAEALTLRILAGQYPPGRPLPNEAALLAEFGVSRTCLREALQMLVAKGLLRSRPKLGTFVRQPHDWNFLDADILRLRQQAVPKPVFLRELFAVRLMIEPETSALAAVNATPAMIASLEAAIQTMVEGKGAHTDETIEADVNFHRLLLAASGNALLSGLGACVEEGLRASISVTSHPSVGSRFAVEQHRLVFEAVRNRDAPGARRAMEAVLQLTKESLEKANYGETISPQQRRAKAAAESVA
jgi:DNA-binding FadR family transcriptional regulator